MPCPNKRRSLFLAQTRRDWTFWVGMERLKKTASHDFPTWGRYTNNAIPQYHALMNTLLLQMVVSFVVGGIFIEMQTIIAERVTPRMGGIVLTLPSTLAISFLCIGLTLSPEKVASIIPVVPLTLGISVIAVVTYVLLARLHLRKIFSMLLCITGSISMWLLLSVPLAITRFSNIYLSLTGFLVIASISHYFLSGALTIEQKTEIIQYTFLQKLTRVCTSGALVAFAVLTSKLLGPFWGGIVSAFPVAILSSLLILHWHHNGYFLQQVSRTIPVGFSSLVIFALATMYTFPLLGAIGGTIASYVITSCFILLLVQVLQRKR